LENLAHLTALAQYFSTAAKVCATRKQLCLFFAFQILIRILLNFKVHTTRQRDHKMKTGKNTPKTIVHLDTNINYLWTLQRQMKAHLKAINTAHKNIPALRKKADEDGVPGSNEAFNTPIIGLQEDCDHLITIAENIRAFAGQLLTHNPEEW
jgi:hypothetical protein